MRILVDHGTRKIKQLNLGGLIQSLHEVQRGHSFEHDNELMVRFDSGFSLPGKWAGMASEDAPKDTLGSYRGDFSHVAVPYEPDLSRWADVSVLDLLAVARSTVGAELMGYKGGIYRMDEGTPVWAACHGEYTDTIICGVEYDGTWAILCTWHG